MSRMPKLLLEYTLLTAILVGVTFVACALSIAFDIHQTRLEFTFANAEWRRETFRRLDQLMWKADTALELGNAARLDLGNALTKIRAQVKQSSDVTAAVTKTQTQAATKVVTEAIDTTRQAIQAVTPAAPEKPADEKPIAVNVPPPVVTAPAPPVVAAPHIEVTPVTPKRRRWYGWLWPWGR